MKAVVMAGGDGARLRPLTVGRPKPMVPLVNKVMMTHILELLRSHGITEVVVTLRYLASAIQDFYEDGSNLGMKLHYVVEDMPLGTAGSVKNAAALLDDTFLVISGDALTDFNLREIIAAHRSRGARATITVTQVPNPLEYGATVIDDEGTVVRFLEKPSWGEVISDTVNTGIYVLEPEILDLIPEHVAYDFSKELFPCMLGRGMEIYGHVAEGYWCDIGNIEEYRRASADLLSGRVRLPAPIGSHIGGDIWVGQDVEIAPSAQLYGPIYLGDGVKIKGDVQIYGPTVIRDYTVIDNYNRIERSIIWRNNYIGESCELRGVIVTRQCSIKPKVVAYEGVVIGDHCTLGEGAVLHPDVKLWPHKQVDAGATVKESIIWGTQGHRTLFTRYGVSGTVNVDLTSEYAAKLGAALGATIPKGKCVAINRDAHRSSRMLKRALVSGLPGAGINVFDLESVAIPVLRHFVRKHPDMMAGIHVRISPFDQRVVDIRFMNEDGMNLSSTLERTIERNFFREDFRRAYLDEIGIIEYAHNPVDEYIEDFLHHIDVEQIRQARLTIVVDYSHGLAADALADILTTLGVDVVPLNARVEETKLAMLEEEFMANQQRVSQIVRSLEADVGIQFDVGGEKLFLIDEQGNVLDNITAALLMSELALCANPGHTVAALVHLPKALEKIADRHDGRVLRISNSMQYVMLAPEETKLLLAVDGAGNYIFPDFHPAVDGLMAAVRLLEYMVRRQLPLSDVIRNLPPVHMAHRSVPCPWEAKGKLMRLLRGHYREYKIDTVDGLKILLSDDEWVHLIPNPDKPFFEVAAEATSTERAQVLVATYSEQLEQLLASTPF
ncbi:MAG: nucleotidyl transferase [Chloroflexi bacterium]|nr:MAG: nucleotidyl transferase [Chloroflexota bacterium]